MKALVSVLLLSIMVGCSSTPELLKGGEETAAPQGYVKLCIEHSEVAACQQKKN